MSATDVSALKAYKGSMDQATKFIPLWVKIVVAIALGLGTMVGWKRIVVTVGEKIGKTHLTYAQGAAAELVAMATIGAADGFGLPVSTTHVLSSGVAGTMAANGSGLQMSTLRNLALAWVLTLPVAMLLSAASTGCSAPSSERKRYGVNRGGLGPPLFIVSSRQTEKRRSDERRVCRVRRGPQFVLRGRSRIIFSTSVRMNFSSITTSPAASK